MNMFCKGNRAAASLCPFPPADLLDFISRGSFHLALNHIGRSKTKTLLCAFGEEAGWGREVGDFGGSWSCDVCRPCFSRSKMEERISRWMDYIPWTRNDAGPAGWVDAKGVNTSCLNPYPQNSLRSQTQSRVLLPRVKSSACESAMVRYIAAHTIFTWIKCAIEYL